MVIVVDMVVAVIRRGHQRGKRTVSVREGGCRKLTGQEARVTIYL